MSEMYVALLRGINVGGKNILPMRELAAIFAGAGCAEVKTYIQSGNVIFRRDSQEGLAEAVCAQIKARHGLSVPVVLRSAAEMRGALEANPFTAEGIDADWLHVMLLRDLPNMAQIASLDAERSPGDRFAVRGREIYLYLPNGAARTKLTNAYFDGRLGTVGTQRNWRTMLALGEMMGA